MGNSGLGCLICPANGDKDRGILEFKKFLESKRNINFANDKHIRDILVIGDNPQKGGNDHYFLNGKYGTAFSVSDQYNKKFFKMPYVVKNKKRDLLFNSEGSLYLLKYLLQ